MLASILY